MKCPECQSENIEDEGQDGLGNDIYECVNCGHQFDSTEVES